MDFIFDHVTWWHWVGLGILFLIVEMLVGTVFLLCLGVSSLVLGLIVYFFGAISLEYQLLLFAFFAVISTLIWRKSTHALNNNSKMPILNRRGEQYVGRVFTLDTPIVNGIGKTHIDDTFWRIKCKIDLPVGARIRITGTDGVMLLAEEYI